MDYLNKERKVYSESFKQMVVSEVIAGESVKSVSKKYDITGNMTVLNWCRKYDVKKKAAIVLIDVPCDIKQHIGMPKESNKETNVSESDRIKMLEYELALYKKLIEIAKRDYNLDLLKKPVTKPSKK